MTAARHVNTAIEEGELSQGLGRRHVADVGITAATDAVAIAISESDGTLGSFKAGDIFMGIAEVSRSRGL